MYRFFLMLCILFGAASHGSDFNIKLINGQEAKDGDFPEVVYLSFGNSRCSGTIVGPEVLVTAAHCGSNGSTASFQVKQTQYNAKCTRAPLYPIKDHDVMLCKINKKIDVKYAHVGKSVSRGTEVSLAGYGCIREGGGGGNDGILRWGPSKVVGWSFFDMVLKMKNGSALCFGDSGGPAFLRIANPKAETHYLVGVNSKGNIKDTSYDARLDIKDSVGFMENWSRKNSVNICGLDGYECKDDDDQTPGDDDCNKQLVNVKTMQNALKSSIDALEQCMSK